ncbi:MAG: hypothetical protein ACPLTR_09775 [Thermacetogeniaceae bacterium]
MADRPTGISYEFVFEPDIDSMVKALRLVLEGRKEKEWPDLERREPGSAGVGSLSVLKRRHAI